MFDMRDYKKSEFCQIFFLQEAPVVVYCLTETFRKSFQHFAQKQNRASNPAFPKFKEIARDFGNSASFSQSIQGKLSFFELYLCWCPHKAHFSKLPILIAFFYSFGRKYIWS